MVLTGYELELLQSKLDEINSGKTVSTFTTDELSELIKKIENITTKLVKECDYTKVGFILCKKNVSGLGFRTYTNISGKITNEGLVDLDRLNILINTNDNDNKISIHPTAYNWDMINNYNIQGSGYIYL